MAVFKNGPNGSFSGKVGSVVGYKWKGLDVIRGLPRKSQKPRSEARLANEQAMKLIMGALKSLKIFIRTGFRQAAEPLNMTAFNLALSINKKQAIKGEYPNLEIDWTKFMVSRGPLPGLEEATATWTDTGLHICWQDNTGTDQAYGTDNLSILVYVHERDIWIPFLNETTRDAGECSLPAPEKWKGTEVEVFLSFISFGSELVSDSTHVHVSSVGA
ncbi:DUF6266 family protein [Parapedobacter indicus]|uniref:Uncharacterized protein n=1 Tax=Parapedobacter indicus TaxID=1477437 RepID=A0A1I3HCL0_9SPHI|nr:DUF6266 family protein [Parapedobacter indicus]PPL02985.1 hypothetical protein CLV26_103311 [Parapedobacter indicus]SFI33528.1 hypothetical protein SAMN05444682_103310 [Parapedobacter indicus]